MDNEILQKAYKKAIGNGVSSFAAMTIQISSLMWLRTTMNYQYRYGGSFTSTISTLYNQGGILRFYKGYPYALMMGPICRFSDTASNAFTLKYLENKDLPLSVKTLAGSTVASINRIFLMPIDTLKTSLQVNSNNGLIDIKNKIKINGFRTLYNGSTASVSATFLGHYPWFLTYNYLNETLPKKEDKLYTLFRNGTIGFSSAVISDITSNSLRVIKTSKQTYSSDISYINLTKNIINKDGIKGLFGRGLKTRIITNGTQGIFFVVLWKYIEESFFNN